ncbi:MAG: hypothetical protein ACYC3S_06710 [Chloroflexota bacterium]
MRTLYETIHAWREAQRALTQQEPARQTAHQQIIDRLVGRLRRHRSLADLASGYYKDGNWWLAVLTEFSPEPAELDGALIRDAAYYQRLLQLRQPHGR